MATTEQDKIIEGCGVLTWFDANKEYIKCGTEIGFPNDYLLCSKCEIRKEVNKALQSQKQKIIEEIKKSYPFIESELINAFVQGWYDGIEHKNDIRKLQVAKDYLVRIKKEFLKVIGEKDES